MRRPARRLLPCSGPPKWPTRGHAGGAVVEGPNDAGYRPGNAPERSSHSECSSIVTRLTHMTSAAIADVPDGVVPSRNSSL